MYDRFNKIYPPSDIAQCRIDLAEVREFFLHAKGRVAFDDLVERFGAQSKNACSMLKGIVSVLLMEGAIWRWPGTPTLYSNTPPPPPARAAVVVRRDPTAGEIAKVRDAVADWKPIDAIAEGTGLATHLVRAALTGLMSSRVVEGVTTTACVVYRVRRSKSIAYIENSRARTIASIQERVGGWSTAGEMSARSGLTRQRISQLLERGLEDGSIVMSSRPGVRRYAARTLVQGKDLVLPGMRIETADIASRTCRQKLAEHGLMFLGEVARMREPDVAALGLGRGGLESLVAALAENGLRFGMDIPDWLSFPLLASHGWEGIPDDLPEADPLHLLAAWIDAKEFAGKAGLSRFAADRMLNRLVAAGKVQRTVDIAGRTLHAVAGTASPSRRRDDLEQMEGGLPAAFANARWKGARSIVGHLLETRGRLSRMQMQALLDPDSRLPYSFLIRTLQRMAASGDIFVAELRGNTKIYSVHRDLH